jgi:hypothetical protein
VTADVGAGAQPVPAQPPDQDDEESGAGGIQGLRDGLAALASLPGAARERLGAERDAVNGLRVTAGQVVGSQYVYNLGAGPNPVALARVSAEEIEEASEAFVRQAGSDALARAVETRPLVLLSGPAGAGKCALARALLVETGPRPIYLIDPATDIGALYNADLEQGADFIFADLRPEAADRLTSFDVRRLEARLAGRDCRLIITVPSTVRIPDAAVRSQVVSIARGPEGKAVAAKQLEWRLGPGDAARAAGLLRRADVRALILKALGGEPLAKAAELGRLLADAAAEGPDDEVADKAASRLGADDDQAFAVWLEGLPDLSTQCLAIAVAVFGGEAYETVASLGVKLEDLLQTEEGPGNPPVRKRGELIGGTRSRRLAAIEATLTRSRVETRYGGAHGQVVRYRHPGKAVRVLRHIWAEYDEIREILPSWLRVSAGGQLPTVGVRAAVAAGMLAGGAFDRIQTQILVPWAADRRARIRDAAAVALHVAASESGHAAAACNLVLAWSADGSNPRLRSTAARAWRVIFERDGAEAAFGLLHSLAAAAEEYVTDSVCRSLTEYMALEGGRYCLDALDLIAQWAEGGYGPHHRLVGELAFLYAAADLVERTPAAGSGAAQSRPSLYAAAERDNRVWALTAALWAQTLSSPDVYESAHRILAEWAVMLEPDSRARASFVELLAGAAVDERTAMIIRHEAAKWANGVDGRAALRTASAILHRIPARS